MSKKVDAQVKKLKQVLISATDFSQVAHCFMDLTDMDEFCAKARPKNNPTVMSAIEVTAEQMFTGKIVVAKPELLFVNKYHLYHGALLINGMIANIFYFTDLDKGMLTLLRPSGETTFARITTNPRGVGPVA